MGVVRVLGSLLVIGALAGSGYAAYELYDAREVRAELDELRVEVRELRDRQAGLRAGRVQPSDLGDLTGLVRRLDDELESLRRELGDLEEVEGSVERLRADVDRLSRTSAVLARCLERGLVVDDDTDRATCPP